MSREMSFRARLGAGWPMIQLMNHYCLTDNEYDWIIACLQEIRKNGGKK